ncbi:hypothetical protein Hs20B_03780 [Lactococcus insecticola]|uniref:Mga helix-turn-helix domain-containing protein n=1 Tax=Pseudolactococcus insecticola TaxID=2709158 RepID=A0A6A0B3S8_9LACT|nr:hypothetical protein Hs20B_03780 [Lactococcus insecticola]
MRELNQVLEDFNIAIKNGQMVGDELQIRYFYYQLLSFMDIRFSINDPEVIGLIKLLQPEFARTLSKAAQKRLACWNYVTRHRLTIANHQNDRLTQHIERRFKSDQLYLFLNQVVQPYFQRLTPSVSKYEGAMLYSFMVSFYILGEENFSSYDLTRRKKIGTAMLDTFTREMILNDYGYQRLSIEDERGLTYHLAQIHAQALYFRGNLTIFDQERLTYYYQAQLTTAPSDLLARLMTQTFTREPELAANTSAKAFIWQNYANLIIATEFSLHHTVFVGIELSNLTSLSDSLYHFLVAQLSGIAQVTIEKYRQHQYYDLVLTTVEKPIAVEKNRYYLSEFISDYDIKKIKIRLSAIKREKQGNK